MVEGYTEDMQQINYSAFQIAKILELQEKYEHLEFKISQREGDKSETDEKRKRQRRNASDI